MSEKGVFTNAQEKKLSELVDDAIKANTVIEMVDGAAAKLLIGLIDDQGLEKLPEAIKQPLKMVINAVMDEDVDSADDLAAQLEEELQNIQVSIPGIDAKSSNMLIKAAIYLVIGGVNAWIERKKINEAEEIEAAEDAENAG